MAKNRHTFAKRQREMEKKRKAEEKREKRRNKGENPADDDPVQEDSPVEGVLRAPSLDLKPRSDAAG